VTGATGRAMAATAPAAHTIEIVRAEAGELELRHTACGGTWTVPVATVVPSTMLDVIHTVIDHQCGEFSAAALSRAV
jgi:hypothetical protein